MSPSHFSFSYLHLIFSLPLSHHVFMSMFLDPLVLLWRSLGISLSQYPTLPSFNKMPRLTINRIARSLLPSRRRLPKRTSRTKIPRPSLQRLRFKMTRLAFFWTKVQRWLIYPHFSGSIECMSVGNNGWGYGKNRSPE